MVAEQNHGDFVGLGDKNEAPHESGATLENVLFSFRIPSPLWTCGLPNASLSSSRAMTAPIFSASGGARICFCTAGLDIGILSGENVIVLRKVEIEANDYAWREYGATDEELDKFVQRVNTESAKLERAGRLVRVPEKLEEPIEKLLTFGPSCLTDGGSGASLFSQGVPP